MREPARWRGPPRRYLQAALAALERFHCQLHGGRGGVHCGGRAPRRPPAARRRPGRAPEPPVAAGSSARDAPGPAPSRPAPRGPAPPPPAPEEHTRSPAWGTSGDATRAAGFPCGHGAWQPATTGRRSELGQVGFRWKLGLGAGDGGPGVLSSLAGCWGSCQRGFSRSRVHVKAQRGQAFALLPEGPLPLFSSLAAESQLSWRAGWGARPLHSSCLQPPTLTREQ